MKCRAPHLYDCLRVRNGSQDLATELIVLLLVHNPLLLFDVALLLDLLPRVVIRVHAAFVFCVGKSVSLRFLSSIVHFDFFSIVLIQVYLSPSWMMRDEGVWSKELAV